jgi:ParB/RepB/Spo0J family partition protein
VAEATPPKTPRAKKAKAPVEKPTVAVERTDAVYVPIGSITKNDYNPNAQSAHDFELLLSSIRTDGFTQPILVHRPTMEIIDGEHRWKAAQVLGMTEVPVVFSDMSEAQRKIATLRHNRARGSEDVALSAQIIRELADLGALDQVVEELNLEQIEVNQFLKEIAPPEVDPRSLADPSTIRQVEAQKAEERKEEEAGFQHADAQVFRLTLTYAGEEANIVKTVLGQTAPAEKVVALCRKAQLAGVA